MPWSFTCLGILAALLIALYQERSPEITVACSLGKNDPGTIHCVALNSGRAPAESVIIGFNEQYPIDTIVRANPSFGLSLRAADPLPDPAADPSLSSLLRAFSVLIPRVAAHSEVHFEVATLDADNRRAAQQVVRIRSEIESTLRVFHTAVASEYPAEAARWPVDILISARRKEECFFKPSTFSFELGEFHVSYIDEAEMRAKAAHQDTYSRRKPEFASIFAGRPSFKAPVLRVQTTHGPRTVAVFPPYIKTFFDFQLPVDQLRKSSSATLYPPVPTEY